MATTINALKQPLRVLKLGLPGNTYTQEGLAILAEYLSGNMNLLCLKQLARRVLTVDMMLKGMPFSSVFNCLQEEYNLSNDNAFSLTTRVFRGGGFTKDYLYLGGFRDMVSLNRNRDLTPLFTGKASSQFLDTLSELIERNILLPPQFVSKAISSARAPSNQVMDYLVNSIK